MELDRGLLTAIGSVLGLALLCIAPASAADPNAGKTAFRQQCALCHSAEPNDNGGAQGPSLQGIFDRGAAGSSTYTYSQALRESKLVWDSVTLDRFLAAPTAVVPGSSMVVPVPRQTDRENLIAYFRSLGDGTFKDRPEAGFRPPPNTPVSTATPPKGDADWRKDSPGRLHHVKASELPPPFDTPSVVNFPRLVPRPENAQLSLPAGFKVEVFADKLQGPREMHVAPNGDIFVSETRAGRIKVLRPTADGARAAVVETFAQGLMQPFGLALYPQKDPKWLYVAEVNRVVRYAYNVGDLKTSSIPEVVVAELSPVSGGHHTRDLGFSLDGRHMYVSVGSLSNAAEDLPKKSPDEIKAWQAEHGVGAAWGDEARRAAVWVFDVDDRRPGRLFASGLRNCLSLDVHPSTGDVWCTTNERDGLGDQLVPDFSTRVKEGGFYGWPWYYIGANEDPRHKDARPDLKARTIVPDVLYTPHSAATGLTFYTAASGSAAFPKDYVGGAFAVLHGSWNRSFRTGHKVVRLLMKDGAPTGQYEDFMTGFIVDDGNAWGRPSSATVASDGALLVSDDGAHVIYRIAYTR